MKVGVIGIGNIAQKAYLPVMAEMRDTVEWHLCSRNKETLELVGKKYSFDRLYTDMDEWMDSGIEAAFVHVATAAHATVIRSLLDRGIAVYVDKPISDDLAEVKQLIELADSKGLLLTAGFNRRFAPMIRRLKEIPDKNMLFIRKDRINLVEPVRQAVYDLFLHIADAALYLLDEEVLSVQSKIIEKDGNLKRIWVELETKTASCFVSMNYEAGANQEVMEIQSPEGIVRVVDLTNMTTSDQGGTQHTGFGDWEGTLRKRGFEPLIRGFIEGIMKKENPVTTDSAYLSHSLCEKILQDNGY
ncbi:Gfo/Idh/MocA family oxidoreductase [uncultured Trichococcus sp.]|uniref:Gfo/Idh/MocA family protein n=1 Tax=uncultured Trichococcus sp. TaxID=189665 RepID=UPI002A18965E|nr:Gfo/Idh/MocA family oxidoreductase [uncultured Trichococcus sp.]